MVEATTEDKPTRRRAPRKAKAEKEAKPARSSRRGKSTGPPSKPLEVRFGQISGNEIEAGVRIVVPAHQLTLTQAVNTLRRRRLECRISLQPDGDSDRQTYLFEGMKTELNTIVDTGDLTVGTGWFATRLTFATENLEARDVLRLSKKEGTIALDSVASQDGDED